MSVGAKAVRGAFFRNFPGYYKCIALLFLRHTGSRSKASSHTRTINEAKARTPWSVLFSLNRDMIYLQSNGHSCKHRNESAPSVALEAEFCRSTGQSKKFSLS
ncbi:hypothetical protein OCU04_007268 [Sclerotinia nivalis]|uniref:Uncharacterized protein n=1 Tax=Sclerotinia nivalis TaxID=352851 RepID=A0A9X0ALG4_9HELO|nr:hypothetical protein OCU04_007268 [Sclerotinia nivalis]